MLNHFYNWSIYSYAILMNMKSTQSLHFNPHQQFSKNIDDMRIYNNNIFMLKNNIIKYRLKYKIIVAVFYA